MHYSPYPGAGASWPRCAFCGAAPVVVSARVREGDEGVVALVPPR
jgi:hypothetical protein